MLHKKNVLMIKSFIIAGLFFFSLPSFSQVNNLENKIKVPNDPGAKIGSFGYFQTYILESSNANYNNYSHITANNSTNQKSDHSLIDPGLKKGSFAYFQYQKKNNLIAYNAINYQSNSSIDPGTKKGSYAYFQYRRMKITNMEE
ncbi:MAG: hypothetical protein WCE54_13105 [Ignavibacteriaceae bacterium]